MNQEKQSEALRLSEMIERYNSGCHSQSMVEDYCAAAVELRRLHAENTAQRAELCTEAARTAEWKLRADQMAEQHRMQTNMRKDLEQKVASLQEELPSRDSWLAECRDAFSLPAVNTELDHHFCSAMTASSEVPAYVIAQAKSLEAQPSAIGAGGVEALRKPLQAVEFPDSVIAGALFDFCGYLTTMPKDQAITVSGSHEASSIVEALKVWAANRSLHLDDADVSGWRVTPAQEHATQLAGECQAAHVEAVLSSGAKLDPGTYVLRRAAHIVHNGILVDGAATQITSTPARAAQGGAA